jgi:hypothetical protein
MSFLVKLRWFRHLLSTNVVSIQDTILQTHARGNARKTQNNNYPLHVLLILLDDISMFIRQPFLLHDSNSSV